MSHPATLLREYLKELNERIAELDAKSDGETRTLTERISKLDVKLDNNTHMTNEAFSRLDSKLDAGVQLTDEVVSKLASKLNDGVKTVGETISKLDGKLDGNIQTTNQAIGELYREKLSVQEFREFVNLFNKILSESFPLPEKSTPQFSVTVVQDSNDGAEPSSRQNTEVTSSSRIRARDEATS